MKNPQSNVTEILFDAVARQAEIFLRSGESMTLPLPSLPVYKDSGVRRAVYSFANNTLIATLARGEEATIEIQPSGVSDPRLGRLVIYLDQCHWSALSRHLYNPTDARGVDKKAAETVIELVRQKKIILPISSGHFIETTVTYNDKRQNIAATMLEFSRGWQMRHPFRIWRNEIATVFSMRYGNSEHYSPPVFTLEPEALSRKLQLSTKKGFDEDLPEDFDHLLRCLTAAISNYDILMDPNRIERGEITKWVEHFQEVSKMFKDEGLNAKKRYATTKGLVVIDLINEVQIAAAETNTSRTQLEDWFGGKYQEDLSKMPSLGLYADALNVRLSNSNTKWVDNDFIDILFLTCATAYADLVVGEKAATNYLSRAWGDRPASAPVVKNLSELVDILPALLNPTDS
ncbi:hypothetical protein ABT352_02470 [Streptosporangium sp. NPDC000563]|uniref:hypothetical protein n=1 Tax=Streptosporangium sp. NPDC000563 TaxID=3154366 RepID=UPI00332B4C34